MNILILGGDGYLGWPTAMHFSQMGHAVTVVDNYFKRHAGLELDFESLIAIPNLTRRTKAWKEITGKEIKHYIGDITDYNFLKDVFITTQPDTVIHYAEQPSAPYSMISRDKAAKTLQNNLTGTLNIIYAIKETVPNCHLIKLGTMGEYGTPNIDIPEGYIDIAHNGKTDKFLFPRQGGSLYHTTKVQDTDMIWFYVRTWKLRATDLMQGPVYGISTDESAQDVRLTPSFHYDEIFGTVLNRFIVQAVCGHPITIYGKGTQIRGYLNIKDTLACVYLSAMNPPEGGTLNIYNQITETFSVLELADKVSAAAKSLGYEVTIKHIENPRIEKEEHYYNPTYTTLKGLGLTPNLLTNEILVEMLKTVLLYKDNISVDSIFKGIKWK
ncbi:MAG: NAD-dependent epimerase/dehydratase family protein [Nitrospirae bacterium]|nr:NAD-dependent epimerase/dehydratase family protein [Nitrospirota bacterium]